MPLIDTNLIMGSLTEGPMDLYLNSTKSSLEYLGVLLQPDITGGREFCFHNVLIKTQPNPIKGVSWHTDFECLKPLSPREFAKVQSEFVDLIHKEELDNPFVDFANLFFPVFIPQRGITDLELTVAQVAKLNDGHISGVAVEPFPLDKKGLEPPIAFLPSSTWFDDSLEGLTIHDVLTIFPKAEAEMLALAIGRAVCGSDGTIHTHKGQTIGHAWRTFCLIYGFSAGTGKSTFFTFLFEALEECGYSVAHFNDLDQQFGLGDICTKQIAYADDLLTKTLKKLLEAPLFKQVITGAKFRAHIKYAPDVEVKAEAAFFANVNDFNPNLLYGLDNGSIDRLAILSTYDTYEIGQQKATGLSAGSPNLKVREHIEWLSNKLGVDRKAIMLKFATICAKRFMTEIENDTLETTTHSLKRELRTQLHQGCAYSITQLMIMAWIIRTGHTPPSLSNGQAVQNVFLHLNVLLNDPKTHNVREVLKQNWIDCGKPSQHVWVALKIIDNNSVNNIVEAHSDVPKNILSDSVKVIKMMWQDFRLSSGFSMGGNIQIIKQDWSVALSSIDSIMPLALEARKVANSEVLKEDYKPDTSFLKDPSYDRHAWAKTNEQKHNE